MTDFATDVELLDALGRKAVELAGEGLEGVEQLPEELTDEQLDAYAPYAREAAESLGLDVDDAEPDDGLEGLEALPSVFGELVDAVRAGLPDAITRADRTVSTYWGNPGFADLLSRNGRGDLTRKIANGAGGPGVPADRARELAQMLVDRSAILQRVQTLPHGAERIDQMSELVEVAVGQDPFGPVNVRPAPYPTKRVTVEARGRQVSMRYLDVGRGDNGQPPIFYVHGHGSSIEEAMPLIEQLLPHGYRVIVADQPGTGYSDKPGHRYKVRFLVSALEALLAHLGVERCVVAGGSLGGNITLRFGLLPNSKERFPKLCAWAPAGWIRPHVFASIGARSLRPLGRKAFFAVYDRQKEFWYDPSWPKRDETLKASDTYREEIYSPAYHRAYFDIAAGQTASSISMKAKDIHQPVLLMCGKKDSGLGMYTHTKDLFERHLKGRNGNRWRDEFHFGMHSIATMEANQVATYMREFLES